MQFPAAPLGMRLRIAPGADLSAHPSTYDWKDVTRDLALSYDLAHGKGSQDEQGESNSSSQFVLKNPNGRFTSDNAMSDLYPFFTLNCPISFDVDLGDGSGWHTRFIHYGSEFAEEWPAGNPHRCITHVEAAGLFRRLGQGETFAGSMERAILVEPTLVNYWKMYDPRDSLAFDSYFGRGQMTYEVEPGVYDPPEFRAVPQPPGGGGEQAALLSTSLVISPTLDLPAPWSFEIALLKPPDADETDFALAVRYMAGATIANQPIMFPTAAVAEGQPKWWHYYVTGQQVGGNIVIQLYRNGVAGGSATIPGTIGNLLTVSTQTQTVDGDYSAAEFAVYSGVSVDYASHSNALQAWAGERGRARIVRVAGEENLPVDVSGGDDESAFMGPQPRLRALDIFRDVAKTDGGWLDDSLGTVGYRALHEGWNQESFLTVNGAERRELFLPFSPVEDDLKRRNRIKATMPSGEEAEYIDQLDITGVPGFRAGVGEYSETITRNVYEAGQLPHHAGLAVRRGTIRGKRYPGFTLNLRLAPQFARRWLDMDLGDIYTLTNPPRQHNRADVDLLMVGMTEVWRGRRGWIVTANAIRADSYEVHQVEATGGPGNNRGRVGLRSSTIAAATTTATATAFSVASPGVVWRTGSGLNYDLDVGGERVTVTAITGATSPQTFTVTRTLPKIHRAGTPVQLWRIPFYAPY